jgi:hypothetical protein
MNNSMNNNKDNDSNKDNDNKTLGITLKWSNIKLKNNIKEISIILYSYNMDQLVILSGKESNNGYPNKTDTNLISNFRGKLMNDESIPQSTGRILFEKTMNMIMEPYDFENLINDNKVKYVINKKTITFLYYLDYNKYQYIPDYYGRIFRYLTLCTTPNSMNNWVIDSCPLGFLDKSELYWTNINDIKNNQNIYKKKFLIELYELLDEIKDNKQTDTNNKQTDTNNKQTDTNNKQTDTNNKQTDTNNKQTNTNNSFRPFWFSV